ncbi:MAG: hypothetical protein NZ480_09635 [Bdellovibrionaceae bacterium]|nr:hypothetical protein [Pseudobdellovibrionaceae bacterium]MDW8190751.1 hypothetical protein [Pseudobdellovibrionaceae bacterium]
MKQMKKIVLISGLWALLLGGLWGCAHSVHQVHVVEAGPYVEYAAGKVVKAKAEQFVIFHFVFDTDYVDQCYRRLLEQCPGGHITGVTTRYWTSLGFFSWTNKVEMQGLCVPSSASKTARN